VIHFKTTGAKLTTFYVVLFFASSAIMFATSFLLVDGVLRRQVDFRLASEMQNLQSAGDVMEAINARAGDERGFKYSLRDTQGHISAGDLQFATMTQGYSVVELSEDRSVETFDRLRLLGQPLGKRFLTVAIDTDEIENVETTLWSIFGLILLATSVTALIGGRWVSRFYMHKLDRLADTAEAIALGDVARRMPLSAACDEFDRVSQTLNIMLDRNAALLESQRQISNDVAHDLRTPLTRLRQNIERGHYDSVLRDTDEIIMTMNALLRIAEIEGCVHQRTFKILDLSHICQNIADAYQDSLSEQSKALIVTAQPLVNIYGDSFLLTQMISNLVENTMAHTPNGTVAHLDVSTSLLSVDLNFFDDGPGVADQDLPKITQRFFRTEKSRLSSGSGLGLSLVLAIAKHHGAILNVRNLSPGLGICVSFKSGDDAKGALSAP
jgi:signal transduction histidine kinase